jgi:hypothetical protein
MESDELTLIVEEPQRFLGLHHDAQLAVERVSRLKLDRASFSVAELLGRHRAMDPDDLSWGVGVGGSRQRQEADQDSETSAEIAHARCHTMAEDQSHPCGTVSWFLWSLLRRRHDQR